MQHILTTRLLCPKESKIITILFLCPLLCALTLSWKTQLHSNYICMKVDREKVLLVFVCSSSVMAKDFDLLQCFR